ncbi:MAG: DMT family transporter [Ignavibacteria bacterium]|jgi:drug/metabolite transporter (DMT)-like permease|nr:DMT family transporter [Ignavibacteria bacterium]MDH7527678.1 EamA family transporter [Ignavibacteria bacterium]
MYRLAPIAIIVAAALWGLDGIVLRPSLYTLPVPLVVLIESSIVALLLTPFFIKKIQFLKNLKLRDWLSFFAVALFGGALGTMAITKALFFVNYANLSVVVLIQKLQPVFAISLAAILLKEKLQTEFYLWAGIALIGAYLMTFGFHLPALNSGDKTPIAVLFSLIAAISFGSSTVFSKRALKNVGFEMGTYLRFLISSVVMIIIVLSTGDYQSISKVSQMQWIVFLIIAFTTGGPAIFLYYYGLKSVPASVSAICELSFPLTAVLLEYFVHGNMLDLSQWVGVILLIGGILKVSSLSK